MPSAVIDGSLPKELPSFLLAHFMSEAAPARAVLLHENCVCALCLKRLTSLSRLSALRDQARWKGELRTDELATRNSAHRRNSHACGPTHRMMGTLSLLGHGPLEAFQALPPR